MIAQHALHCATTIHASSGISRVDVEPQAGQVSVENFVNRVLMSADLDEHLEHIQHYVDLGFDEVYVHNVGRNQDAFIQAFGREVLPRLRWPSRMTG